ncbi:hypothetical protein X975_21682, partial [Stegodyphus mimosarum]
GHEDITQLSCYISLATSENDQDRCLFCCCCSCSCCNSSCTWFVEFWNFG